MFWVSILFLSSTAAYIYHIDETTTTVHPDILIKRYQMECIEETRVDPDAISQIQTRHWDMHYEKRQLVKDWALCVLMKSGVMSEQGVYKMDVALRRLPLHARYVTEAQIDTCLTEKAMPAKDIAYIFVRCFQRMHSDYAVLVSALV